MRMKQMMKDIIIEFEEPVIIYYDNTSIVSMSKNLVLHSKTKHISIKYHVLRQKVVEKEIRLEYVSTKDQNIDIFTKIFPKDTFKYLNDLLKIFGLESCKLVGTPMIIGHKLSSKDETPAVEQKKYISMIGDLQYLTQTRLDIENVVGIVARFQVDPKEYDYAIVKRIFIYLKETSDYGIWYGRLSNFTLCAYTDADWASNLDDKKSTSGGAFFLGEDWFLG